MMNVLRSPHLAPTNVSVYSRHFGRAYLTVAFPCVPRVTHNVVRVSKVEWCRTAACSSRASCKISPLAGGSVYRIETMAIIHDNGTDRYSAITTIRATSAPDRKLLYISSYIPPRLPFLPLPLLNP